MSSRRLFLGGFCVAALLAAIPLRAQQAVKVWRIGFLSSEFPSAWAPRMDALRAGLRDLGYVEGRNITIESRWAEGKYERLSELAAELVRLKVDVIVAGAALASRAAQQATTTIPIVMVAVGDAVDFGLVSNLARPDENLTGSTFFGLELAGKRIELLKEALPRAKRIAVLINPNNTGSESTLRAMQGVAKSLQVDVQAFEVRKSSEFEHAFSSMAKLQFEALAIPQQPIMHVNAERIAELAAKHRLAWVGGAEFSEAGCLIGYGPSFIELYRRAANFVDKITRGARPIELPIERPTKFELIVNMKTAKRLGLKIPQSILLRADRVIE